MATATSSKVSKNSTIEVRIATAGIVEISTKAAVAINCINK